MSLFPDSSLSHQIYHLIWGNPRSMEVTCHKLNYVECFQFCVWTSLCQVFFYCYKALQSEAVKILLFQPVSEPPLCLQKPVSVLMQTRSYSDLSVELSLPSNILLECNAGCGEKYFSE